MRFMRLVLIATLVCGAGIASSDEPITLSEAASAEGPEVDTRVTREIDVDLIDLERLREAVEGQAGRERLRLTLEECVYLALDNNQEILVLEYDPLKSEADIFAARGEFDPVFGVTANYLRATREASPEYKRFGGIDSTEVYQTMGSTSVGGKLHWGTMYTVQLDLDQTQSTWNSFTKEWSGGLTLTASQPLLRGRRRAVNLARIRMAKCGEEAAQEQLRLVVINTIAEVTKAYWDLVGAIETVKVSAESLANAERLLEISKKRLEIGTAAAIEVLQSKAGVAMRQSDLISARARRGDAEDVLKHTLDMRDSGYFSSKQIIPIDRPEVAELNIDELRQTERAVDESAALALELRPEMRLADIEIENAEIEVARAEDGLLPELNLTGSISQGGRGEKKRYVFDGIWKRWDNSYTVGFTGSMPIGNRAARGAHQRALLTLRQAEQRRDKTKQQLALGVRLASRALNTSQILVESNRQARALQETNVIAEEKRLKLGVTTSYRVLQIQEDLTAAQTQELQAQIAYEKALVELWLAEGTLPDHLGIEFETPASEKPISFFDSVTPDVNPLPVVRGWVDKMCGKGDRDDGDAEPPAPETNGGGEGK